MVTRPFGTSLYTLVVERRLARFHPWIIAGLTVLYIGTIPYHLNFILVTVPVAVVGWFYYRKGGFWAAIVGFILDLFLIDLYLGESIWESLLRISNGILVGHLFVLFVGMTTGFLREEIEKLHHNFRRLNSQERVLILINMIVKDILERRDVNEVYFRLVSHITNLFVADYGYLVHLDKSNYQTIVLATTTDRPSSDRNKILNPAKSTLLLKVLETGHSLFIEDARSSQLIKDSALLNQHWDGIRSALAIPLSTKDYMFGAILMGFDAPTKIDQNELTYFELSSSQITLALKNVLQEQKIEKQLRETRALASIENALSESERISLDAVLQLIVNSARELIPNSTHVVLHLLDYDQQLLIPRAVSGEFEGKRSNLNMHLGEGLAGQVLYEGKVAMIRDVRTDNRFINQTIPATFRSIAVAPVVLNQKRIGTISILNSEVGGFQLDEIDLLASLGTLSAIAIENSKMLESIHQSLRETSSLYEISREMVSVSIDELLNKTVGLLQKNFGYYVVQVYLFEPETGTLVMRSASGEVEEKLTEMHNQLEPGAGIVGHVYATSTAFMTSDVGQVPFYIRNPLLPETRSELAVPIRSGEKNFGVLDVQQAAERLLTGRDSQMVSAIADQLAVALQRAELYESLQMALEQEKSMRSHLMQSERLAVVGRLLASISHELNNPLQAIQNVLFLLKDEKSISAQGREDLEIILSETERMTSLIGRLRATYRTPTASEFIGVRINSVIEDIHALTATYMRHKNIVFEFMPDMTDVIAVGIPDQLRQVLLNLFMNAIDAMPTGGKISVCTEYLPGQDKIYLTVSDNGPGIAPQILPSIFEPFTTDKDTGTGLGMTIARDIVLQHRGEILAQNKPEGGAIIKIWLPAAKKE